MNCKSSLSASVLALVLSMGFAAPSMAANDESGQKPPAEAQTEQKPMEDKQCASIDTGYYKAAKGATFKITLNNICERRLRCEVRVYHVDSSGPHTGKSTMRLEPKSKGAKATKAFSIKVTDMGGSANIAHDCKKI